MKKKIANMWVNALRSDEYTQGCRALCRVDDNNGSKAYCCLGVLCDLYQKNQTKNKKKKLCVKPETTGSFESVIAFAGNSGVLPSEVLNWAGMSSCNGKIYASYGPSLVTMNDNGKTFIEIADYIEKFYKEL
jgi:hypothetical protein